MLHLSNQNTKVLGGGGVIDLYGGDMSKELQKRMTEQLDATTVSNSSMPTNTSHPSPSHVFTSTANTSHTTYTNTNIQNNAYTDPRVASEINDLSSMDMSQFDDADMDYFDDEDVTMDPFDDIFQNTMDDPMDEDSYFNQDHAEFNDSDFEPVRPTTIPSIPVNNDNNDDDDDDFAPIQSVPVKSRLIQKQPKPKERSSSVTTQKPNLDSLSKRPHEEAATSSTFSSKRMRDDATEEILPVKKEKEVEVDSVHWIDPSTWLDEDEEEEGVEIKPDGTTHVTFDALRRILNQMEDNTFTGSIADAIIVRAKFIKMAKMRFSALTGFYALFDIGDPLEKSQETIRILIGNKVFIYSIYIYILYSERFCSCSWNYSIWTLKI